MPRLDRETTDRLLPIKGTPPSLITLPPGCPFHPRCRAQDLVGERCRTERPQFRMVAPANHISCHLSEEQRDQALAREEAAR